MLQLLANQVVELHIMEEFSYETVRRMQKRMGYLCASWNSNSFSLLRRSLNYGNMQNLAIK